MKLVIDPQTYPDVEQQFLEIKKTGLHHEIYDTFLHIIDGSWRLSTFAFWYRNEPSLDLSYDLLLEERTQKYDQWFCHAWAIFREDLKTPLSAFRYPMGAHGFEFVRGFFLRCNLERSD
jgi:hypothetical protein